MNAACSGDRQSRSSASSKMRGSGLAGRRSLNLSSRRPISPDRPLRRRPPGCRRNWKQRRPGNASSDVRADLPGERKNARPVAEAVRELFLLFRVVNVQRLELIRDVTMHERPKSDQGYAGVRMAKTVCAVKGSLDFLPREVESRILVECKKAIQPVFSVRVNSPSKIKKKGFALTELVSIHGAPDTVRFSAGAPIPRPDPQAAQAPKTRDLRQFPTPLRRSRVGTFPFNI